MNYEERWNAMRPIARWHMVCAGLSKSEQATVRWDSLPWAELSDEQKAKATAAFEFKDKFMSEMARAGLRF